MTIDTRALAIRQATSEDVWAVRKLFQGLHDYNAELDTRFSLADGWERYLDEHLRLEWNGARSLTLVAWDGERPIGLLMLAGYSDSPLFKYRHWAEILTLYIDPDVRGGMLAYRFVKIAKRWATDNGYDRIQLYVTSTNDRARRFYQKAGFESVQEVWRLELTEEWDSGQPGRGSENGYDSNQDPLTSRTHQLSHEDD